MSGRRKVHPPFPWLVDKQHFLFTVVYDSSASLTRKAREPRLRRSTKTYSDDKTRMHHLFCHQDCVNPLHDGNSALPMCFNIMDDPSDIGGFMPVGDFTLVGDYHGCLTVAGQSALTIASAGLTGCDQAMCQVQRLTRDHQLTHRSQGMICNGGHVPNTYTELWWVRAGR
jgi:hypothetical protein